MDRYIGRLLDDRYEILEAIGAGGMAVVYKARCHRLNRLVAIKILRDENLQDDDFRRRFHAEGQAVGMLSHPNIVSVYDVSSADGVDYIVMELVEGITLKQYMEKKGVLNWKETLHFATQIAKALDHAHSRGLVHRDIKPHNVMVMKNGSVRVTDFGIARIMTKSNTLTKEALGSVHYISPEQAKGERVDCRSDLYSLGVVMYEMITGRPPYDGESPVSVAIQHIAGGATKPSMLNPNIPAGLEQIIMKAMAHDRKDRYASAMDMISDMDMLRMEPTMVFPQQPEKKTGDIVKTKPQPEEKAAREPKSDRKTVKPKRAREYEDEALGRGRVATITIVCCCVAIMVAAVIFLILLANGGLFQNQEITYKVPSLVGLHFEKLPNYEGIRVVQQGEGAYSDEYPVGCIIRQLPAANTVVESGRTVFVIVSLGPKPADVIMPEVVGSEKVAALTLLSSLNMNLKVEVKEKTHDTVEAGVVIESSVETGSVLHKGQQIVLTVSVGKGMAEMPDLVRNGTITKEKAEGMLNTRELTNVTWVAVDSLLPAGIVVSQSVLPDTRIDVTTNIVVEYSNGIPPIMTISHTFQLPINEEEGYLITIMQGDTVVVRDVVIHPGETSYTVTLTGRGEADYIIYINWEYFATVTVKFE